MANLTRTNWPLGWTPSEDAINGNPNGLLRMDNLRIDKDGVVGLIDGQRKISASFSDFVENLFAKIIGNKEYFWISTGQTGTAVVRLNDTFTSPVSMVTANNGLNNNRGIFGDAFGYVLALAGAMRTKDPVTTAPIPLGLLTPSTVGSSFGPSVLGNSPGELVISAPTQAIWGTSGGTAILSVDTTNFIGVLASPNAFDLDTTEIGQVGLHIRAANDIIQIAATVVDNDTSLVDSIELNFLLDGVPNDPDTYQNYYTFLFTNDSFPSGINTQFTLSAHRGSFNRYGNNQDLDWTTVKGIRIVVNANAAVTVSFSSIKIIGGISGQVNGTFNYIQQNITDNGHYLAKSPVSAPSDNVTVINGSVLITAIVNDPNANIYRFYRKSVADIGIDPNTGLSLNASSLNQYYFVGEIDTRLTSQIIFKDSLSDEDVLLLNADGSFLPNLFLDSMNTRDSVHGLQDTIYDMEGVYRERMLYMGASKIYLSDRFNPDAVDQRFTLQPSGDSTEINLWLKKLTNNVLILATSKTIYEISGTLLELPDGTLDINLVDLGESHPPISVDVCNFNGSLYYIAADGLRATTGSNSVNLSPQLRHLFNDVKLNSFVNASTPSAMRHGVPGVAIYQGGNVNYSICAAHSRIYFVLPMQDGSRRLFFYDIVTKTYGLMYTDPQKIFATPADELIGGYGSGAGNTLFLLDYKPGYGVDSVGMPFVLRTVFDSNQQPRNRKDLFTLKLVMDTGNDLVSVEWQKDGVGVTEFDEASWGGLGTFSANGQTTIYIPLGGAALASFGLGFRYAFQIKNALGGGVKTFKLYELTLEYEARPEQLDYLRILPTNMGTISRKRWTAFAFVIDTLGNSITFTPYLDNVAWASTSTVSTGTKLTYIFYFTSEAISTDIGGTLSGGVFEFYQIDLNECISEKLPPPVKYLIIPPDNYGTPNRKRHTSYKFQILTRQANVQFIPVLDGVAHTAAIYNTGVKKTVEYFFSQSDGSVVGVDIGGVLTSLNDTPFEYYGNVKPQTIEVLPDRLEYLQIPNSNFGIASKKRIRTLPLVIDTYGANVTFTPTVDGVVGTPQTLNTTGKRTTYYYFNSDSFGTDYGGTISGGNIFEFYEMLRPAEVEILPVPKLFDQLGPIRLDKIGKLFGFRLRLIQTGTTTSLPWALYDDFNGTGLTYTNSIASGNLVVVPNEDEIYEVQLRKNVNAAVMRLVLGPTSDPFHRYDVLLKVQTSGMESESKWMPIR